MLKKTPTTAATIFPFKEYNHSRLIPWIVSLISYLALLIVAGCYVIYSLGFDWQQSLSHQMTVEWEKSSEGESVATFVAALRSVDGIDSAKVVTAHDLEPLLETSMPAGLTLEDINLPTLVNVTLSTQSPLTADELKLQMTELGFGSLLITDHRVWQGNVKLIVVSVLMGMLSLAIVAFASSVLLTIFATRTSLNVHHRILEILNFVGAPPRYIARQFQKHFLYQGLRASALSLLGFWCTAGLALFLLKGTPSYSYISPLLSVTFFVGITVLAFSVTLLMYITTRMTVLRSLAKAR